MDASLSDGSGGSEAWSDASVVVPAWPFQNASARDDVSWQSALFGAMLGLFALITVFGNVLVIAAVFRFRQLKTMTNYFVISLACADLMVGAVVMPFAIVLEVSHGHWLFGRVWCDIWHSLDVFSATASILDLCVIGLDRYWAITDPISYPVKMSHKRCLLLIALIWTCSALLSFPSIAWWRATLRGDDQSHCRFPEDGLFLIVSSTVSFWAPLLVMLFVYAKIYRAATLQMQFMKRGHKLDTQSDGEQVTLRVHRGGQPLEQLRYEDSTSSASESVAARDSSSPRRKTRVHTPRRLARVGEEHKAARTLSIVVGCFIVCWLPFFTRMMVIAVCGPKCDLHPEVVFSLFTWLGYMNSGMNPIIYSSSSRDFRQAFHRLLCAIFCCSSAGDRPSTRALCVPHRPDRTAVW